MWGYVDRLYALWEKPLSALTVADAAFLACAVFMLWLALVFVFAMLAAASNE